MCVCLQAVVIMRVQLLVLRRLACDGLVLGLHDKLEEFSWTEAAWPELYSVTVKHKRDVNGEPVLVDVNDDLKRELQFFNQVCATHTI